MHIWHPWSRVDYHGRFGFMIGGYGSPRLWSIHIFPRNSWTNWGIYAKAEVPGKYPGMYSLDLGPFVSLTLGVVLHHPGDE